MGEERREERRWRTSDAEEVAEILTALGETVPKLIRDTIGAIVSEEVGRNLGRAVGSFYKELREAGIAPEEALKMAKEYMANLMKLGEFLPGLLRHGRPRLELRIRGKEGEEEEAEEEAEGEEEREGGGE